MSAGSSVFKIYLVRHARPVASWGQEPDPGLDAVGIAQAQDTAAQLAAMSTPTPIYSSPLRRCRETAAPLEQRWQRTAQILNAVAEIPAPSLPMNEKTQWLADVLRSNWTELPHSEIDHDAWRTELLRALFAFQTDCVVFTHFVAINVAVGAAEKSDKVVTFTPDHGSITVIECRDNQLYVIRRGREAQATVVTQN